MSNQVSPKTTTGCLAILAIVILSISYLATSSFNPLTVYSSDSLLTKIVVSLLGILLATSLLQLFAAYMMRKYVAMGAIQPPADVICPGCGLPLIHYISSHGMPIQCPVCKKFWHNGPACYNKNMPRPRITFPTYPCPHCREAASHDQDLFNHEGSISF